MQELTDEEKEKLYLNPVVSIEEGLRNKIARFPSKIKDTEKDLAKLIAIRDDKFSEEVRIEFNYIGISKKEVVVKMYKILIADWKKELKEAKLELKNLLYEQDK